MLKVAKLKGYIKSSIPFMQKLSNKEDECLSKVLSQSHPKVSYASELCLRFADSVTINNLNYNK